MKKELLKPNSVRQLAVSVGSYTAGSILGPLLIFGGAGFFLDKVFNTKPFMLIGGVFLAFIATNFFIYKRVKKMMKDFDEFDEEQRQKEKENIK